MQIDKSNIIFRKAAVSDTNEIKVLAKEVVLKNYSPVLGHDSTKEYADSETFNNDIDSNIDNMFLAVYNYKIIGFVVIKEDVLELLMINYCFQRLGIGSILLKYAENIMFKKHDLIKLDSFEDNINTNNFYKKSGWKIVNKEYSDFLKLHIFKFEKHRK